VNPVSFGHFVFGAHPTAHLGVGLFGGASSSSLLFFALMIGVFAMMVLPQQRKQKQWNARLAAIKTGDKVTTSGGIRGTVISIKDDALVLRTSPDNIKLEFAKAAVSAVTTDDNAKT
jgi:preprotein translocase subunit YajC